MAGRIKILQTIRQGKIGGGERHVIDLVENMDKDVFEPIVLSFTDGEMIQHLNEQGIETHVMYTEQGFDRKIWPQVTAFAKSKGIQLVHAHGTRACSNSYRTSKDLGIPLLYTVHGWSFHDDQKFPQKQLRTYFEGVLIKKTNGTIFVSEDNRNFALKRFKVPQVHLAKNGVNLSRFNPESISHDVRAELGIPKDHLLLGYIARITEQKDPFTLLKALKRVVGKAQNVTLLMVGDGNLKPQAEALIQELSLELNINFQPFRTDIPAVLKAVDVYCLPSLWEGLPIGVLEAMAMGKPVIATPVGGTKELIQHEHNGLLMQPYQDEEMARHILRLYKNEQNELQSYGQNSLDIIKSQFSVEKNVNTIQDIYLQHLEIKNEAITTKSKDFSKAMTT